MCPKQNHVRLSSPVRPGRGAGRRRAGPARSCARVRAAACARRPHAPAATAASGSTTMEDRARVQGPAVPAGAPAGVCDVSVYSAPAHTPHTRALGLMTPHRRWRRSPRRLPLQGVCRGGECPRQAVVEGAEVAGLRRVAAVVLGRRLELVDPLAGHGRALPTVDDRRGSSCHRSAPRPACARPRLLLRRHRGGRSPRAQGEGTDLG